MKILLFLILSLVVGCSNEEGNAVGAMVIYVKNSEKFNALALEAKFTPKEAEERVLDYILSTDSKKSVAICGPVVAIFNDSYLLSVPDKFGKFYLNGYIFNYTSGEISYYDGGSDDLYEIKGEFRPTISKNRTDETNQ